MTVMVALGVILSVGVRHRDINSAADWPIPRNLSSDWRKYLRLCVSFTRMFYVLHQCTYDLVKLNSSSFLYYLVHKRWF